MLRTLVAGLTSVAVRQGPFTADLFVEGAGRMQAARRYAARRYAALVPTQLARLLRDSRACGVLAALDGVMVGGASLPAQVLEVARARGVRVVRGYGASEVAGGVLYEGRPVHGCTFRVGTDGRLWLGGPMVAAGYLDNPGQTREAFTCVTGFGGFRPPTWPVRSTAAGRCWGAVTT